VAALAMALALPRALLVLSPLPLALPPLPAPLPPQDLHSTASDQSEKGL